jgi:putative oxidoreductase
MRRLVPPNLDAALLLLRLVLGIIMLYHGVPKLMGFGGVAEGFEGMGIPLPTLAAAFSTIAEAGGGLLLVLGVATDIAGLLVAVDMLGAILFVHLKNGFSVSDGGVEWPLALFAMGLALALAGGGRYALRPDPSPRSG